MDRRTNNTERAPSEALRLNHGVAFEDLYDRGGLVRIDAAFLSHLAADDPGLAERLKSARAAPDALDRKAESELLIEISPYVDDFLAELFDIEAELAVLANAHEDLNHVFTCRRLFVQRVALKKIKADDAVALDGSALERELTEYLNGAFDEDLFARAVLGWLEDAEAHGEALGLAARYAAWRVHAGDHGTASVLFKTPGKIDPYNLVPVLEQAEHDNVSMLEIGADHVRRRDGFELTEPTPSLEAALSEGHYCIFCHNQGKDSCAHGLSDKKTGEFRTSTFGVKLAGCPLEEKISEMHLVKTRGEVIGALAMAVVDNPMVAGTGHRICNDCMKACVFQKQEPVDTPLAETRTLADVLELPWGFEIYGLLTRWNPLNLRRPLPRAESGYSVLVVGLGPSGFTLAHHLLNDGHFVAAIDGAKIEPLAPEISGVTPLGERVPFQPIHDVASIYESLDDRVMAGFGGVAEYGITVRWNKNYLKIIRLLLERWRAFAMYGGVRFGGQLTEDSAYAMGFDHIALCAGAGRPTVLNIPNGLAPGVRQASDFLMALQLTGAAKANSITNLQLRLPVVVVGGGLTAVDTATESLAYYVVQVEKFVERFDVLSSEQGVEAARAGWSPTEAEIAEEFLAHGRAIKEERRRAATTGEAPQILELLNTWGGVTLAYRRRLIDAPSYTLNHEEVEKAMEEGVRFAETLSPVAVEIDAKGWTSALRCAVQQVGEDGRLSATGEETVLAARSVLVAAGTQPNTILARERPGVYELDGKYFRAINEHAEPVSPDTFSKPSETYVIISDDEDSPGISFFGDLHPSFKGNVVSAMASAKRGYPVITRVLSNRAPNAVDRESLLTHMNDSLRPVVHEVVRLTPKIIEIIVHAPRAARMFQPGQFYRLQNYEALAPRSSDTTLAMEGLAMTGAWVDREQGLVSIIALEMGGSSDICQLMKPGDPVVLMGPTGMPTETPGDQTVVLVGGGLGNAVLFSIGQALRAAGSRVLYFAGYKALEDRYHVDNIQAASDMVIWCSDEAPGFVPGRPQDRTFVGNMVDAMKAYASHDLGHVGIPFSKVDRLVAIGSDGMMAAVAHARHNALKGYFKDGHVAIGSINSPMQCMMKEICAQCLQRHIDPDTGEETVVFSCFNQDQPLDHVDFKCLRERLSQNATQEKLTAKWVGRALQNLV